MEPSLQSLNTSDAKTVEEEETQTGREQRWPRDTSREVKGRQWKSKNAGEREERERTRWRECGLPGPLLLPSPRAGSLLCSLRVLTLLSFSWEGALPSWAVDIHLSRVTWTPSFPRPAQFPHS